MKKIKDKTHTITYSQNGQDNGPIPAFGKSDLFGIIRDMLKDGVTSIQITVLNAPQR
jgi:hypothetical protein